MLIVWNVEKECIRRADTEDLLEAIYMLTMLIPIGRVTSYGDIAKILNIHPRLVGYAMKRNDKPLITPCHRVVGSNGELKNYGRGGPRIKKKLLLLEGVEFEGERVKRGSFINLADQLLDP